MTIKKALLAAFVTLNAVNALAQNIAVDGKGPYPYWIDVNKYVVRTSSGECWRTIDWNKDLALKAMSTDGKPLGCVCEPSLKEDAACKPAPAPAPAPRAAAAPAAAPASAAPTPAPAPTAAPAPAPAAAPAAPAVKVTLPADATFDFGSADLTQTGKDSLTQYAASVSKLKSLEVLIVVGHADRIGKDEPNQTLSEKRAASVKDFLVSKGIAANRIYAEGKGEKQPVTGDKCKKMGAENGKNKKLVACLAPDRRIELEAVGVK